MMVLSFFLLFCLSLSLLEVKTVFAFLSVLHIHYRNSLHSLPYGFTSKRNYPTLAAFQSNPFLLSLSRHRQPLNFLLNNEIETISGVEKMREMGRREKNQTSLPNYTSPHPGKRASQATSSSSFSSFHSPAYPSPRSNPVEWAKAWERNSLEEKSKMLQR